MQEYICPIHNIKIEIYKEEEIENFKDNNESKVAIFINNQSQKILKRYIKNKCDENCETIKYFLEEENNGKIN